MLEAIPHPPEIGEGLMRLSEDERMHRVTVRCIILGRHSECYGVAAADDGETNPCLCPCHS